MQRPSAGSTRQPGFDVVFDPSGFYRVGHIYKDGPADHDFLKIREGDYIIALDGRDLKTTDNYWRAPDAAVDEQAAIPAERQAVA